MVRCLLVVALSWCAATHAHADPYAGLQLAPAVHGGVANRVLFGGAGAELSYSKWLLEPTVLNVARRGRATSNEHQCFAPEPTTVL